MSSPEIETATVLRAKAERCMRLGWFQRDDISQKLVTIASDYLERAVKAEEQQREKSKGAPGAQEIAHENAGQLSGGTIRGT